MDFEETASKIESMEIRGAAKIARSAAEALKEFCLSYDGPEGEFFERLDGAAKRLIGTRPTAISLWNAVQFTMKGVKGTGDPAKARELVVINAESFVEGSIEGLSRLASYGARRIPRGASVLTHCNSQAALETIFRAHDEGRLERVFATESRPKRQGHITVRQVAERGIDVTMLVDSAVRYHMPKIDTVVVGADTVASNGAVINKIGTSQIALCAHEARVPFMVCAETFKFSPKTMYGEMVEIEERDPNEIVKPEDFKGVRLSNPVFDATPPEYIDVIVTEIGVISPFAAYEVIAHMFGHEAIFGSD